jgi:hypothetical protein
MKNVLNFCCAAPLFLSAQTFTLTQAFNEPDAGDFETSFPLDSSAFTSGMPLAGGAGISWNFSAMKSFSGTSTTTYVAASSVSAAAGFPGCNIVQQQPTMIGYLKTVSAPTTQVEMVGFQSGTLTVNLQNTAVVYRYPFAFGSSVSDAISGTAVAGSYSATCTGTIVTNADATGTLTLPGGIILNDVLRIKSVQSLSFVVGGFIPAGSAKQTIYAYYHQSQKYPVMSISYSELMIGSGTPSLTASLLGNTQFFTNVDEHSSIVRELSVFPNPVTDQLFISDVSVFQHGRLRIFDPQSRLISEEPAVPVIKVSDLPSGVYFLEYLSDSGTMRKKFLKL